MLLTVKQVQERLNVSKALVYRLIDRGEIVSHRIGSSIRVAEEDLQAYLERTKFHGNGGVQWGGSSHHLNNLEIRD